MKKRLIACLLVLALLVSLCAVSAVAGEEPAEPAETVETGTTAETETTNTEAGGENTESAESAAGEAAEEGFEEPSLGGPDEKTELEQTELDPDLEKLLEKVTLQPERLDSISYGDIEKRIREQGLAVLALQESIDMLESIDYEDLKEDLRKQLNDIARLQWGMVQIGQADSFAYTQMQQGYDALREQFDAIKDGEMQEDNIGAMRQVKDLQAKAIMGAEMLYVTLAGLEVQEAALQRQLASMNRTIEEMELRYQMGQISALQLSQTKAGQTNLSSGLETLRMNIRNNKARLEGMLGAEQIGEIRLGTVPEVTEKQLASMDVERDLLEWKARSYELYAATKTLEDEQEVYKDAASDHNYNENKLEFRKAKHTWQAAQYKYNNTIQEQELKFRTLYAQVHDYQQILEAAKVSLESEKLSFAASEIKYEKGNISQNAYLTAQDDLKAAEDAVQTAVNDLFSSYNTYCWAVEYGILN